MYNASTNLYIFVIMLTTMVFELFITKLMGVSPALLWGLTIGLYFLFILYQVLMKINEDAEKNKVKNLLYELMDGVNGIPIVNKNEKLIIKWDIVFKKLVDHKEYGLYDKLMKTKTQHIDYYVNKYPSLLIDDNVDFREAKYNVDLNTIIKGKKKKDEKQEEELIKDEDCKKKLFIRDFKGDMASFSNYNSSLYFDVIMKNEFVPENADEMGIEHDPDYDGFSVWMMHKDKKYNVVPRIMLHKKLINKEKWFIDNINALVNCATAIVNGDTNHTLYVDNFKLMGYIEDMPESNASSSFLKFVHLKNENLVFAGIDKNNKAITANCEFKTGYNRFEVLLKSIEIVEGDKTQVIDAEKTVAIGSSFQPMITLLEKMPELIGNIERVICNQDISSIVIS